MLDIAKVGQAKTLSPGVCLGNLHGRFFDVKLLADLRNLPSPILLSPRIQRLEAMAPGAGLIYAGAQIGALNGLSLHQGEGKTLTDVQKRFDSLSISPQGIRLNSLKFTLEHKWLDSPILWLSLKARDEDYPRSTWFSRRLPLTPETMTQIILGRIAGPEVFEPVTGTPAELIIRARDLARNSQQLIDMFCALGIKYAGIQDLSLKQASEAEMMDLGCFAGQATRLIPDELKAWKQEQLLWRLFESLLKKPPENILSPNSISYYAGGALCFGRDNFAGIVEFLIRTSQERTSDPKIQDEFFVRVLATLGIVKYQRPVQNDFLNLTGQSTRIITEQLIKALEKLTGFLRERLSEAGPEQPDLFRQPPEKSGTTSPAGGPPAETSPAGNPPETAIS